MTKLLLAHVEDGAETDETNSHHERLAHTTGRRRVSESQSATVLETQIAEWVLGSYAFFDSGNVSENWRRSRYTEFPQWRELGFSRTKQPLQSG